MRKLLLIALSVFILSSCGGGSETTPNTPDTNPAPIPTPQNLRPDASRLLAQASFGATTADIENIANIGLETWIDNQLQLPASSHQAYLSELEPQLIGDDEIWRDKRVEAWFYHALTAPDQLRQRVAFALSEIFVVSEQSNFGDDTYGLANYYDMLAENAFGNYRALLEKVTLHPIMGMYLSMLGNQKPDLANNIRPDENYAREVMQLFSIGLVELNNDGTIATIDGAPIPTYNQDIIKAYARVYTGWNFNGTTERTWYRFGKNYNTLAPMTAVQSFHDTSEKLLLNGVEVPAGQTAEQDLAIALDSIFNHPNVGPFISKQLIQKLVTSNPTPEYVDRIANVFNNNGQGVRGDLAAVIKAILLDDEARNGPSLYPDTFGKIREPILRATQLWRAFNGFSPFQRLHFGWPDYFFNQAPLAAPHVFNFFSPNYTPPGELSDANLLAPELQIASENYVTRTSNFLAYSTIWGHSQVDYGDDIERILIDLTEAKTYADTGEKLVDYLDLLLTGQQLSAPAKTILANVYDQDSNPNLDEKIANIIFLLMTSPQYTVQR